MRHASRIAISLFFLFLAAPSLMWGQATTTGTVIGRVLDQTGAVIPGAQVILTDVATKTQQEQPTNPVGRFVFIGVKSGTYDVSVTAKGFRKLTVLGQQVMVGKAITLNLTMEVGAATQTVEVKAVPGAELQMQNSTMGQTVSGGMLSLSFPVMNHDVAGLLGYQATAAPSFNGTYQDVTSGSIAGSTPDQNTFVLDGVTNTSGLEGDNGYINGFSGSQRGVVPTPIESIEEVTLNTNNTTADFSTSSGGQMLAVTKRGRDQFHGSGFDFFQGDWLNANSWGNNFSAIPKPKSHQNFFGGDLGGTLLPNMWGGKTYFYVEYEGQRNPDNIVGPQTRAVPSDNLRKGIIQINTSKGIQSFNLANPASLATACGPAGGLPCDTRGTGMSSVVATMWNSFMPAPNYTKGSTLACYSSSNCDSLNTFSFRGNMTLPLANNEIIGRIDHDFGSKYRFMSRYSWFRENVPRTYELDIGGLLPGDTKGKFASASSNNNQPAQYAAGLQISISPSLTNSFHFGYTRNEWNWIRNGVFPQIPGAATLEIDSESTQALQPINVDTQNSRNRAWYEHNWDYRDELTWLKGNHLVQFGGEMLHEWWHFDRYDNVVGGLTTLIDEISQTSIAMTPSFQPQDCSTGKTPCIDTSKSGQVGTWNKYYADVLGLVTHSSVVATRTGANLQLNPLGTPARSFVTVDTPSVYFSDAWKIKPNVTLTYGLNWSLQLPPHDLRGAQDVLVDPSNNPITYSSYAANRVAAANAGQTYTPVVGFTPVGAVGAGQKYAFPPYYGEFGPRLAVAWSPEASGGFLGTLLGTKATVIRGGYARVFGRDLGINVISNPVLGDGFLQPISCIPTRAGACSPSKVAPNVAFRIGTNADGLSVPSPVASPTLATPVQPGIGSTPGAVLTDSMDQNFRPNGTDQVDFSIQRQFGNNTIVEMGYVAVFGRHLFQGIEMNAVPWMTTLGGQTFAKAYAALWQQQQKGSAITAQPFFESALGGPNSAFCSGYGSCTNAMVQNFGSYLSTEDVTDFWSGMETSGSYTLPMALYTDTGQSNAYGPYANVSSGISNYQALVVKLTTHNSKGLTLNSNFTYGHALGTIGLAQTYTLDSPDNVYNLGANWTPQPWDRKFTFNMLGTYMLPFGKGQRWLATGNPLLSRLVSGWSASPVFTFGSGLPAELYTGDAACNTTCAYQEMGAGYAENGASAVPVGISTANLSNSPSQVVLPEGSANPNSVGINGNPKQGGTGANMFGANAIKVYNSFRPFVLGIDGSPNGDGQLRNPVVWQLDFGITKDTAITERVHTQLFMQSQNFFNHSNWSMNESPELADPTNFGVMSGGLTGPRIIQLGLRVSF
jgi:hypothetical protein